MTRHSKERARFGVGALFFLNGAIFANVVPRYPELKASLELSNTALGLAVAALPFGALVAGLFAGALIARWGSARVTVVGTSLMAANLLLTGFAPNWGTLALAMFIAGSLDAVNDVANNAHGLRVQRLYGRSILNAFHGIWSVGAVVGGLMGAAAAGAGISLPVHLGTAAVVFAALAILSLRTLLTGHDNIERDALVVPHETDLAARGRRRIVTKLLLLGLLAAAAGFIEDSGASWGAVYLREDLAAGPVVAGLAFVALQSLQTIGRLTGDRAVIRFGNRNVARLGGAIIVVGMTLALLVPSPLTTIIGFGAAGLGIATLIPASMHAADEISGLRPGLALTVVAWVTRLGFLVAAPLIGIIADAADLRLALVVVPVAGLVIIALAGQVPGSAKVSQREPISSTEIGR